MGDKVESGKFLEDPDRVSSAEHGDSARKADGFRARGGGCQNHGWGRIEELSSMMFADAEHVQTSLVSKLHLFEEMPHALDGLECETGGRIGDGRCEAVDADLHPGDSLYADDWMIMLAFGDTPRQTEAWG